MRKEVNQLLGKEANSDSVTPVMKLLFENAKKNSSCTSKQANRHDITIKKFASSLYCLVGKGGYELLLANLGCALPSITSIQRMITCTQKICEGEFQFDQLLQHLQSFHSPLFVNIHLDDTRIIHRIEYDPVTDRFVGFCLPLNDGIPICDAFVYQTFNEIKEAFTNEVVSKYAHCVVAQPVDILCPPFVLFVLGTDATYTAEIIKKRWVYMKDQLSRRGICIVANGADGAGPFLKAMIDETGLFTKGRDSNIPDDWSFFLMPKMKNMELCSQDTIHILAKLRTRLVTPTNLLVLGTETACRAHLEHIVHSISKATHGLTLQSISHKDKQNYESVSILVSESVQQCLQKECTLRPKGTEIYLSLMRNIRNAFFDKSLSPLDRIFLLWTTVFFCRIWRSWLSANNYDLKEHFITDNAYTCIELNTHMVLNLIINVMRGQFPPAALRIWLTGSQGCEQMFRLLRSMTPTFSTMINFTIRAMMDRIHKINFLSSMECNDVIEFPRAKRRLLHLNEETESTFTLPSLEDITHIVKRAKEKAISDCNNCNMILDSYDDSHIIHDKLIIIRNSMICDSEIDFEGQGELVTESIAESHEDSVGLREDMARLTVVKSNKTSLPTYQITETSTSKKKKYLLSKKGKSPFLVYEGTIIRKSTALYILQENAQISNDRLLRVRTNQSNHLFDPSCYDNVPETCVRTGDLCIFSNTVSPGTYILGRLVQFSYLYGTKKQREYSSNYCDLTKESRNDIGAFVNWFLPTYSPESDDSSDCNVTFKPANNLFTTGYLGMSNYYKKVKDSYLIQSDDPTNAFLIPKVVINELLPNWRHSLYRETLC